MQQNCVPLPDCEISTPFLARRSRGSIAPERIARAAGARKGLMQEISHVLNKE
jgi:hypothetical protein